VRVWENAQGADNGTKVRHCPCLLRRRQYSKAPRYKSRIASTGDFLVTLVIGNIAATNITNTTTKKSQQPLTVISEHKIGTTIVRVTSVFGGEKRLLDVLFEFAKEGLATYEKTDGKTAIFA
jgi:hypothetical protein